MSVSELTAWVTLPSGAQVRAESAGITLDRSWAPYVSATAVVPVDRVAETIDPRLWQRITVMIRRQWCAHVLLTDLGDQWTGKTLGDLGTAWTGKTLGDLGASWLTPWEDGYRAPDEVTADVALRTARRSATAATWSLTGRSDELLTQGSRVEYAPRPAESLPSRVVALLTLAGLTVVAPDLSAGSVGTLPAKTYTPSTVIWDELTTLAGLWPLRIWCDESRRWHLSDPLAAPTTTVALTRARDLEDDYDLDGDWADVYAVTCHWTSADGTAQITDTRVVPDDTLLEGFPHRVAHKEITLDVRADAWPGPSAAEMTATLARLKRTGRVRTWEAVADPTVRPGATVTTGAPSPYPTTGGVLRSVAWTVPGDTMTVTIDDPEDA